MSDIKLFRTSNGTAEELKGTLAKFEIELQELIEQHLEEFLGIRFLASEYPFPDGRIDTLGIDTSGRPVIIEYKRTLHQNVTTQGRHYLGWLIEHREAFQVLVMRKIGMEQGDNINWTSPRLLCIAAKFTRDDESAIKLRNDNYTVELICYRRYANDFLLLEFVNRAANHALSNTVSHVPVGRSRNRSSGEKTIIESLEKSTIENRHRFEAVKAFLLTLGGDIQMETGDLYFAFKRTKNFACVKVIPRSDQIIIWVKINPDSIALERGFTRDVRKIGHHGTGSLEITIRSDADLDKAQPLLIESYRVS